MPFWLFTTFACLYLLTSGGHFYASDDVQKYLALDAWWRTGRVFFPEGWTEGVGGQRCAWFPLGASVFMLPGYLVGHAVGSVLPWLKVDYVARFCIALQNAVVSGALVALVAVFARRLGYEAKSVLFAAAALGLGTMVWPYAKTAWSEPAATCALFAACYLLYRASEERLARPGLLLGAGACLAAAVSIRLVLAVVAPGALAWLVYRHRGEPARLGKALGLVALPLAGAVAAALWYNLARYGHVTSLENYRLVQGAVVLPPGGRPAWTLSNLWHYSFNPADGLFWFAPATLLGLVGARRFAQAHPALAGMLACALGPLLGFYVGAWGLSDWAWGQRYAYVFQPFLLLPAATLWQQRPTRQALWLGIGGLGLLVQLVAVPQNFNYLYERNRAAHPNQSIQQLMADPDHGPLVLAAEALPATLAGAVRALATPRPNGPLPVEQYRERAQSVPDMWPWLQLLTPLPRAAIALVVTLLLALLAFSLDRLAAACRRDAPAAPAP
ncbi:MAG: hypothetical protein JWM80_1228 [Cyanobacteria bacterium RYN_339]|nr:hypothetical protein [Cyanobacteria bacterium RYN_339]